MPLRNIRDFTYRRHALRTSSVASSNNSLAIKQWFPSFVFSSMMFVVKAVQLGSCYDNGQVLACRVLSIGLSIVIRVLEAIECYWRISNVSWK